MKTKVVFRKYKTGEIIALFPDMLSNKNKYMITCYEHNGQHASADYNKVVADTVPATGKEYADLFAELVTVGYNELVVM